MNIKILLCQTECCEGDISANLATIETAWASAPSDADIIVFPELQLTGFAEPDHVTDRALDIDSAAEIQRIITLSKDYRQAAAVGFLERDGGEVFNTTAFITPEDGIRCIYRKTHRWDEEQMLISAGNAYVTTEWRGVRFGFITCFDIEFPETARATAALGCDVLLVCDGNMDPYLPVHQLAARTRAMENQLFVCLSNRCGHGMGLRFPGHSLAAAPDGSLIAEAGSTPTQILIDIDTNAIANAKKGYDYLALRRTQYAGRRTEQQQCNTWSIQ